MIPPGGLTVPPDPCYNYRVNTAHETMITKVLDHEYVWQVASGEWFATAIGARFATRAEAIAATRAEAIATARRWGV